MQSGQCVAQLRHQHMDKCQLLVLSPPIFRSSSCVITVFGPFLQNLGLKIWKGGGWLNLTQTDNDFITKNRSSTWAEIKVPGT